MLTFGAESPREQVDHAGINLYKDDSGFVVMDVKVPGRSLAVMLRLGSPTAKALGTAMIKMADDESGDTITRAAQ